MYSNDKILIPQAEEGITKIKWVKEEKMLRIYEKTYPSILEVVEAEQNMKVAIPQKKWHKNIGFE